MCKLRTLIMVKKVFVGAEGCRAGWFAIALLVREKRFEYLNALAKSF
jgi:hypothetical protein